MGKTQPLENCMLWCLRLLRLMVAATAEIAGSFAASRPSCSSCWPDPCSPPFQQSRKSPGPCLRTLPTWNAQCGFGCPARCPCRITLTPGGQGPKLGSKMDIPRLAEHKGQILVDLAFLFSVSLWSTYRMQRRKRWQGQFQRIRLMAS